MADKPITYSALKFDKGMTPKVFTPDSFTRIEHFNTIEGFLRPYRNLRLSTSTMHAVSSVTADLLQRFTKGPNGLLYCLGYDDGSASNTPTIGIWETTGFSWTGTAAPGSFGSVGVLGSMFVYYNSKFIGAWKGTNLWRMTTGGSFDGAYQALSYTTVSEPIIHSKDGILYIPYDNKIASLNTSDTLNSAALTFNSTFIITSIAEDGDYISIVGYDSVTGKSTAFLWDRDSSLVTLTGKYELAMDKGYHNAVLGGTTFFVCARENNTNSPFGEKPVLVIKYLDGELLKTLHEFTFESLAISGYGKALSNDKLYFTARAQLLGEGSARNLCFSLDQKGNVLIEQNLGIDTGTNAVTGVYREGDGFWFAAGSDGAWDTATVYTTTSSFETSIIRSDSLNTNINIFGCGITCEALPSGASIVLKAKKNEETSFTTIETFSTENALKFTLPGAKARNALVGLDKAKQVQFRVESTGGAVITGFQAVFLPVYNETYG